MFVEAKSITCMCLDGCPVNVIRQFFNCSWRFMDTYCQGLTGKAAEWAITKQKSHQWAGEKKLIEDTIDKLAGQTEDEDTIIDTN